MLRANLLVPEKIGPYSIKGTIGRGGFSNVFYGVHIQSNEKVAIKVIPKEVFPQEKLLREIKILEQLSHPFCVSFFQYLEDEKYHYLVMELVECGTLLKMINNSRSLSENKCRHYFCQIISALDYLHTELQIAHRDLKVENVMIDSNDNIRLIDFGLSNLFRGEHQLLQTACGSPAYAPPEMLQGKFYTKSADVWSAGIVLYAMAAGKLPFEDPNVQYLVKKIVLEEPEYPKTFSPLLTDLISKMLVKDPNMRITIPKIMEHPWFTQYPLANKMNAGFGIQERLRLLPNTFHADQETMACLRNCLIDAETAADHVRRNLFDDEAASYRIIYRNVIVERMKFISEYSTASSDMNDLNNKMFSKSVMSHQLDIVSPVRRKTFISKVLRRNIPNSNIVSKPQTLLHEIMVAQQQKQQEQFQLIQKQQQKLLQQQHQKLQEQQQKLPDQQMGTSLSPPQQTIPSQSIISIINNPTHIPGLMGTNAMAIVARHNPLSNAKHNYRARSNSYTPKLIL